MKDTVGSRPCYCSLRERRATLRQWTALSLVVLSGALCLPSPADAQRSQQVPLAPITSSTPLSEVRTRAARGDATAQNSLGYRYLTGQGVPQDLKEAVRWYRMAAEQGNAVAQNSLGVRYAHGEGVPQDFSEAVRWYLLAAEQGLAAAQDNLGVMYRTGEGVPQDLNEAVRWYRLAAEQGYAAAQYNLGAMYATGRGVPRDHLEAYKWRALAAARATGENQKRYGETRDAAAKSMTDEQLAEAQKRADDWEAEFERRNQP